MYFEIITEISGVQLIAVALEFATSNAFASSLDAVDGAS
jgi:hypothetical protein